MQTIYPLRGGIYISQISYNFIIYLLLPPLDPGSCVGVRVYVESESVSLYGPEFESVRVWSHVCLCLCDVLDRGGGWAGLGRTGLGKLYLDQPLEKMNFKGTEEAAQLFSMKINALGFHSRYIFLFSLFSALGIPRNPRSFNKYHLFLLTSSASKIRAQFCSDLDFP